MVFYSYIAMQTTALPLWSGRKKRKYYEGKISD